MHNFTESNFQKLVNTPNCLVDTVQNYVTPERTSPNTFHLSTAEIAKRTKGVRPKTRRQVSKREHSMDIISVFSDCYMWPEGAQKFEGHLRKNRISKIVYRKNDHSTKSTCYGT